MRLGCLAFLLVLLMPEARTQDWLVLDMMGTGLPSNTVVDIDSDSNGVVWLATDWGLCRWEAGGLEVFNVGNSGLPDNVTRCVEVDDDDALWVGTSVGGAARYDGQVWEVFNTSNSPMPDDQVNTIHVDHQGWVWFGTVTGLACYTGSEWRLYNSSEESYNGRILNGDHILSIGTRPDGLVALGTLNGGFHFLTDTSVHFFTTFNFGFFDNTQHAVHLDLDANERWLACPAGGLVRQVGDWYGGSWFQYTTFNSDLPSNALKDVVGDGNGGLWLAAQVGGLARRYATGSYQRYQTSNSGIPSNQLNCVHAAVDGAVWVGTYDGGAARLDPASGLNETLQPELDFRIWPNPNEGSFTVSRLNGKWPASWRVADALGRVAAQGIAAGPIDFRVDLPWLAPGSWSFALYDGRTTTVRLFMVH